MSSLKDVLTWYKLKQFEILSCYFVEIIIHYCTFLLVLFSQSYLPFFFQVVLTVILPFGFCRLIMMHLKCFYSFILSICSYGHFITSNNRHFLFPIFFLDSDSYYIKHFKVAFMLFIYTHIFSALCLFMLSGHQFSEIYIYLYVFFKLNS